MTATMADLGPLGAYLALVLVGFLPNEVWRLLGLVAARRLDEQSEILVWVRAVATAVLAGVIAQLVLFPPGPAGTIPLVARLGAVVVGFVAFLLVRRSVFVGVLVGEIALVAGALLTR